MALNYRAQLASYQQTIHETADSLRAADVLARIWAGDHTVWKPEPTEITNRLGWLYAPQNMQGQLGPIDTLAEQLKAEGYTQALLLGMGGSSLAPEVFRMTFGVGSGALDLAVLDSTDPGAVRSAEAALDLDKTLFIVSTKSGGTVETFSFFKYFYNKYSLGQGGPHFIAITDPGSKLVETAERYNFRAVFLADANIGGRYSALAHFGVVPARLIGMDVARLLQSADAHAEASKNAEGSIALEIGAALGALAQHGRDKATFVLSPQIASFGDWVEQLIAESTGKEGKGILPVAHEPLLTPAEYSADRVFIWIGLAGDQPLAALEALEQAGHPVLHITMDDLYDLGALMFAWELATAVAGAVLNIQPFDQPNVESAKVVARQLVTAYTEAGSLPEEQAAFTDGEIAVYGQAAGESAALALTHFISQAQPGAYIALQAYLTPNEETTRLFTQLRQKLQERTRCATTFGYGPRFLHSTGQLHKGDAGKGLFIQFTQAHAQDAPIPDEAKQATSSISFGVLELAQALGDAQALRDEGRPVLRLDLGRQAQANLARLIDQF